MGELVVFLYLPSLSTIKLCPAFAYYGGQAGQEDAGRLFQAEYNSALLNLQLVTCNWEKKVILIFT